MGVCIGGSGACLREDAINEGCLLGREGGFDVLTSSRVSRSEVDLWDEKGL